MGALLSAFRRTDDGDYEKILSRLDEQIRSAEISLSDIKLREKKTSVIFLVYSSLALLLYVGAYFFYLRFPDDSPRVRLIKSAPLVGIPIFIYFVRNLSAFWYKRKKANEEEYLENLHAKQKLKVEELKQKTAYYATRNLLERYDPSSRSKPNPNSMTPEQRRAATLAGHGSRALDSGQNLGQSDGLRQRTPQQRSPGAPGEHSTPSGNLTNPHALTPGSTGNAHSPATQEGRSWMDRLVDLIIGEEGSVTKYDLVCERCHAHNGLVMPEDLETIQYFCPKCNHFNASRRKRRSRASNLQPEATSDSPLDRPSSAGGTGSDTDLQQQKPSALTVPSSRRYHRPSLPDLRAEEGSDDAIEGARHRIERDAISEHGVSTEDEADGQQDREPRAYSPIPQVRPVPVLNQAQETSEGSLDSEDFTEVRAVSSGENSNDEGDRLLHKNHNSDNQDDAVETD